MSYTITDRAPKDEEIDSTSEVKVIDVDIPFASVFGLCVKIAVAVIPIYLLLAFFWFVYSEIFG